jgi:exodeoxyribonuclease VII small subunit
MAQPGETTHPSLAVLPFSIRVHLRLFALVRVPSPRPAKMALMAEPQPFEAGLDELEKVVKELEAGELTLERSLELFEKGMELSETCRKQLEDAETRVEMLIRKDGKLQPEPFRPDTA